MEQQIRDLAYDKWERAGYPPGDGVNFWLEAEQELTQGNGQITARTTAKQPAKQQPQETAKAAKKSTR